MRDCRLGQDAVEYIPDEGNHLRIRTPGDPSAPADLGAIEEAGGGIGGDAGEGIPEVTGSGPRAVGEERAGCGEALEGDEGEGFGDGRFGLEASLLLEGTDLEASLATFTELQALVAHPGSGNVE